MILDNILNVLYSHTNQFGNFEPKPVLVETAVLILLIFTNENQIFNGLFT